MIIEEDVWLAITDRLEGWELVDFLQVPIEEIILSSLENDWINNDNIEDILELIGMESNNDEYD